VFSFFQLERSEYWCRQTHIVSWCLAPNEKPSALLRPKRKQRKPRPRNGPRLILLVLATQRKWSQRRGERELIPKTFVVFLLDQKKMILLYLNEYLIEGIVKFSVSDVIPYNCSTRWNDQMSFIKSEWHLISENLHCQTFPDLWSPAWHVSPRCVLCLSLWSDLQLTKGEPHPSQQ
jgi:hypothetical protein